MSEENKKVLSIRFPSWSIKLIRLFPRWVLKSRLVRFESEWYNFDVLNVPKDHPARDMQDTFWIKDSKEKVLRTHCTCVSARSIEKAGKEGRLPCAFISIGKVFRNEATDATHEMQFYQVDGVMIGSIEDGVSSQI